MAETVDILDPQLMIAHAWNVIQNVKAQLPKESYDLVTSALRILDAVLFTLEPGPATMSIPMLEAPCQFCGNGDCVV